VRLHVLLFTARARDYRPFLLVVAGERGGRGRDLGFVGLDAFEEVPAPPPAQPPAPLPAPPPAPLSARPARPAPRPPLECLGPTESVTARLVREVDWSATVLGPMDAWPRSLVAAVGIVLNSRFPVRPPANGPGDRAASR
jgi:hypothetical protein